MLTNGIDFTDDNKFEEKLGLLARDIWCENEKDIPTICDNPFK